MNKLRFHQLDFCRAVFMYCGLLFHCGLIYGSGHSWRVVSDETVAWLGLLSNFLHHFRMEAFYLVSGFFYLLIMQKQRPGFMQDRVYRALIPMLFIGLTLNIIMNKLSYNHSFDWGIDYILTGKWQAHLWFLGNLIIYFLVAQKLSKFLLKLKPIKHLLGIFIALMMVALIGHFTAVYFGFGTVIFINFGYLFYYFPYFLMGVFAFHSKEAFFKLIELKFLPLYLAIYASAQILTKVNLGLIPEFLAVVKQAAHLPLMLAAFSLLCFIGQKQSSVVRFLSEASYTIYLLHQPLIIILHTYLFAHLQMGAVNEYLLMVIIVFFLSGTFHLLLVDKFPVLKMLFNGAVPAKKEIMSTARKQHIQHS